MSAINEPLQVMTRPDLKRNTNTIVKKTVAVEQVKQPVQSYGIKVKRRSIKISND